MIVGRATERYLPATLASVADVVDHLVVNDNSGVERSANIDVLEASAFGTGGRLTVVRRPFSGFDQARNDAFAAVRGLESPPAWMLFLDADEVHGSQLATIARDVLPKIPATAGQVDAYTFHFYGTFRWITDVARRMMFYRYSPDIRWTNRLHEKPVGIPGGAIVLPYIYHHYGNVQTPFRYAEKNLAYYELGNATPRPPDPSDASTDVYLASSRPVRPYRLGHPRFARPVVGELEAEFSKTFAELDAGFGARMDARARAGAALAAANESLRVQLRRLEHPGLYRLPTVAY